jgi:hypothetical protein
MTKYQKFVPVLMLVIAISSGVVTASDHSSQILQSQSPESESDVGFFALFAGLGALVSLVSYVGVSRTLPPILNERENTGKKERMYFMNWGLWLLIGVLIFIWGMYEVLDATVL